MVDNEIFSVSARTQNVEDGYDKFVFLLPILKGEWQETEFLNL